MNLDNTKSMVWCEKLIKLFKSINKEVLKNIGKELEIPSFEIFPSNKSVLGKWDCENRIIAISADMFLHYEKSVVEFILRHEMAHQIVDEIFKTKGKSHGELFKKACKILDAEPRASLNKDDLNKFASNEDKTIVTKIKKILAKGHCEGATEGEATVFLKKAQKMLAQYNLSHQDLEHDDKVYICRPLGKLRKKMPSSYFDITRILKDFYFVETIKTYITTPDPIYDGYYIYQYYMVIFGEPSNLDIAEYIFEALDRQGENLWEQFKKEKKALGIPIKGLFSKKSFLKGLYKGYYNKLETEKEIVLKTADAKTTALVETGDPFLKEAYHKEFPSIKHSYSTGSNLGGYSDGFSQGQNLKISKGVTSKSNGKLLGQ